MPEQVHTPVVPRQATPGLSGIPQTITVPQRAETPTRYNRMIAAAGVLAAVVVIGLFLGPWGPEMLDLDVYRLGASTLLHGGDQYSVVLPGTDLVFTYTVFAAVLFIPFAVVPGIVAHESALKDGETMKVPQFDRKL